MDQSERDRLHLSLLIVIFFSFLSIFFLLVMLDCFELISLLGFMLSACGCVFGLLETLCFMFICFNVSSVNNKVISPTLEFH